MKRSLRARFTHLTTFAIVLVIALSAVFVYAHSDFFATTPELQIVEAADYYASLDTSSNGFTFRSKLAQLITETHTKYTSYDGLREVFKTSDADPNTSGNVIWFYSGTSIKYTGFGSGGGATNREHVWPKDGGNAFSEKTGPGSDAHHLRPTEAILNSTRNDKQFGEVAQTASNIVKQNGSTSYDNLCYTAGNVFYPGEGYRGATARILMYVQTRWGNDYSLKFVLGEGSCKTIGDIKTLLKWHYLEPPTEEEIRRNEVVYGIQGNRNPFIDHPEYATKIYCYDGESYNATLQAVAQQYDHYTDGGADIESISLSPANATLNVGDNITLTPTIAPSNASRDVTWTSSNPSVATVDATGKVTAIANGTATITAASTKDSTIKSTATITVKSMVSFEVTGTPTKTAYYSGDEFNPEGLTVNVTYSDGSKGKIDNAQCQWLDGVTRETKLSAGTTSIICKLGSIEQIVNGITVKQFSGGEFTITRSSFSGSGAYAWCNWSSGGVSGQGFIYPGASGKIQMNNNSKATSHFIFNTTAVEGGIRAIKITMESGSKNWQIRTSSTPFAKASGKATGGTAHETQQATESGTTWELNTTDSYFAINYEDTGVAYISSITVYYGGVSESECKHTFGEWTITKEATYDEDGEKTHTCTTCGKTETETIPKLVCTHTYGEWTVTKEATYDEDGEKTHTCTTCGKTETETIPKLVCTHNYGEWTVTKEATYEEDGEKTHTCSTCGHSETRSIDKLVHNPADDFKQAVADIENAQTTEELQSAIERAEVLYSALSESEKNDVSVLSAYATLTAKKSLLEPTSASQEGLSDGAIAAIAVACVAVFAGVCIVATIYSKKRRMKG